MHVALVTDTFQTGGGLEHLFQTVKALDRVRFSIWARGGEARHRFQGLENVDVHARGFGRTQILGLKPDLIHFHHLRPLFDFLKVPFPACRVPLIYTAHGLHVRKYDHKSGFAGRGGRFLRGGLEKRLFRKVDRVIAVSREDESFLQSRYGLANTVRILNGVDIPALEAVPSCREELRREFSLSPHEAVFLTVARFDFQKGYDVLMDAVRLGRDRFRENRIRFLLVGDGEERSAMKRRAREQSLTDLVGFPGEREDVPRIMKSSDLFVLPSRWEGLPVSLLEASFCGLPLVASDACGNREIVTPGVNGLLFRNGEPGDLCRALCKVVRREQREALRPAGLTLAFRKRYDINRTARDLERLYGECAR